jgi:hypothetical protein
MTERKIAKRLSLTVVSGRMFVTVGAGGGREAIYEENQHFRLMHKHLRGSNRPRGFFHKSWGSDEEVGVRWLWTEKNGYFAPEITFRPSKNGVKTASVVCEALLEIPRDSETPEGLIEKLRATVVEYIDDQKEGCWDDYRVVRVPGEPAMMTIARAAQGD